MFASSELKPPFIFQRRYLYNKVNDWALNLENKRNLMSSLFLKHLYFFDHLNDFLEIESAGFVHQISPVSCCMKKYLIVLHELTSFPLKVSSTK